MNWNVNWFLSRILNKFLSPYIDRFLVRNASDILSWCMEHIHLLRLQINRHVNLIRSRSIFINIKFLNYTSTSHYIRILFNCLFIIFPFISWMNNFLIIIFNLWLIFKMGISSWTDRILSFISVFLLAQETLITKSIW